MFQNPLEILSLIVAGLAERKNAQPKYYPLPQDETNSTSSIQQHRR